MNLTVPPTTSPDAITVGGGVAIAGPASGPDEAQPAGQTELVKLAVGERAARADKSARTRAIFQRILDEDAALLDALS